MYHKNNCYIYLDARAGISHREDFQIIDTPENFRISRIIFDSAQISLKLNVLGLTFSNAAGIHF